jgi:hypothetical protein
MADKKISQLTAASTPLAGTEVLPIVQSGSTVKVSSDDLTVKNVRSNATSGLLQVAGPAAGTTRVMTTPDANFTVARTDAAQTFTGNQVFGAVDIATNLEFKPTSGTLGAAPSITSFSNGYLYILGGTGGLILRDDGGAVGIQIQNDDYIKFETGNPAAEAARFTSTGNLAFVAAKGIDFSANTGAAGETSALLNWYEEGTWTPVLRFGTGTTGITYTTQQGRYTRVGRTVTIRFEILLSNKGSSTGEADITGLPFNAANLNAFSVYLYSGFDATYKAGIAYLNAGTINEIAANGTAAFSDAQFTNTSRFWGTCTYQV